jgi:hypothetical protein
VKKPRRRWFQFGLRTLFIVMTVVALLLAWELSFIRERQAWLRENPALVDQDATLLPVPLAQMVMPPTAAGAPPALVPGADAVAAPNPDPSVASAANAVNGSTTYSFITLSPPRPPRQATIPFWRKMLGDTAVAEITAPDEWTEADRARVSRLFPEAELIAPIQFAINGTVTLTADLSTGNSTDSEMPSAEDEASAPDVPPPGR